MHHNVRWNNDETGCANLKAANMNQFTREDASNSARNILPVELEVRAFRAAAPLVQEGRRRRNWHEKPTRDNGFGQTRSRDFNSRNSFGLRVAQLLDMTCISMRPSRSRSSHSVLMAPPSPQVQISSGLEHRGASTDSRLTFLASLESCLLVALAGTSFFDGATVEVEATNASFPTISLRKASSALLGVNGNVKSSRF